MITLIITRGSTACEWDYLIWINHSKSADPLYRFVQKGKAGYIDQAGNILFRPKLNAYGNYGGEFHDGLLEVGVSDGKYADISGTLVIDKGFYRGWDFSEGLAVAMRKDGEKWGYIDRAGKFVISPRFDTYPKGYVHSFSDGLAMIEVAKKYGYIDHTGEFVIQPRFLHATDFNEGMARVVVEGPCVYIGNGPCPDVRMVGESAQGKVSACKFAFIDKSGSIVTIQRYDYAKEFSEGLAPVKIGEKWGYIDKQGRTVIPPRFDEAERFSDGLARVRQGDLYGYVDHKGEYAVQPQYKYADDFSDGLAVVSSSWSQQEFRYEYFYYIDKQGNQAIEEKFALASPFFKGVAHVKLMPDKKRSNTKGNSAEGVFAYISTTGARIFTYWGER
ncbi:MAG: WG repeat-containing protein [Acidobacteria bacterium]|nr:WG repeat-containing protein [Acidobacteriota bacterium]MBI3425068.1 WG repeat-containing protein [Acidobacteriota bacterium]